MGGCVRGFCTNYGYILIKSSHEYESHVVCLMSVPQPSVLFAVDWKTGTQSIFSGTQSIFSGTQSIWSGIQTVLKVCVLVKWVILTEYVIVIFVLNCYQELTVVLCYSYMDQVCAIVVLSLI